MLGACLNALRAQTFSDFEIVVVDNGSTDDSTAWLTTSAPEAKVIANKANLGFSAAINQGIRAGTGRYVVTLNNDTAADPGWLAALVGAVAADGQVGMCASRMVFADQPDMIDSTGICLDRVGIAWDRRGGERDDGREVEPLEVFGPCAGAALYRRSMLDEIGLFDEDFFAYLEDVDLAWRARRVGWRCLYVPGARVLHCHSATGGEGSPFKSYQKGRNKVWLILKNYPFGSLWRYVPLLILYDLAAVVYLLIVRRDIHALRGRLAALVHSGRMWRKRMQSPRVQRADLSSFSPLEPPWRVQRRYAHLTPVGH